VGAVFNRDLGQEVAVKTAPTVVEYFMAQGVNAIDMTVIGLG